MTVSILWIPRLLGTEQWGSLLLGFAAHAVSETHVNAVHTTWPLASNCIHLLTSFLGTGRFAGLLACPLATLKDIHFYLKLEEASVFYEQCILWLKSCADVAMVNRLLRMEINLQEMGLQKITAMTTSLGTKKTTLFSCVGSSALNHVLWPLSGVVSPNPGHLTSVSLQLSHQCRASSWWTSFTLPHWSDVWMFPTPM